MTNTADDLDLSAFAHEETIRSVLQSARTIAVVGLSPNPLRPSHGVSAYMQHAGYRIVPVNPNTREVLGEPSYPSLAEVPFPIDIVDVFRVPRAVPGIAQQAVEIGARALWLQIGVISLDGARIASDGGLAVVMDRCIKVEHARYVNGMR
jgi:predicted CoA-binding protein